jgi:hypothetical protein
MELMFMDYVLEIRHLVWRSEFGIRFRSHLWPLDPMNISWQFEQNDEGVTRLHGCAFSIELAEITKMATGSFKDVEIARD